MGSDCDDPAMNDALRKNAPRRGTTAPHRSSSALVGNRVSRSSAQQPWPRLVAAAACVSVSIVPGGFLDVFGALSADGGSADDLRKPSPSTRRIRPGPHVKDDGSGDQIVRGSILELLREEDEGRGDPSGERSEDASLGSPSVDLWALKPWANASPTRFQA